jgi:SAM-dependent methyltransferase
MRNGQLVALDVGCGAGNHLQFLHEFGFTAYGFDRSEHAYNLSRYRMQLIGVDPDHVSQMAFDRMSEYKDNEFDLVLDRASLCYLHYDEFLQSIAQVHRILKPGGFLVSFILRDEAAFIIQDATHLASLIRPIFNDSGISVHECSTRYFNEDTCEAEITPEFTEYIVVARKP